MMDTNLLVACLAVAFFAGAALGYIVGCEDQKRGLIDGDETAERVGKPL